MCLTALDVMQEHFGYQRAAYAGNLTNVQKATNQNFDAAIYYPTNWHNSQYQTWRAKTPGFQRYGGLVPINPEWFQKNYLGAYSLKEQPTINEPDAFTVGRYS